MYTLQMLSGRPAQFAPAEQVKVQMKDALACIGSDVGDETVAALAQAHFLRQSSGDDKQVSEQWPIFRCQVRHGRDVATGDEEYMMRRLWIDIFKGEHVLILVDDFRGYLSLCYFAE